MPYLSTRDLAGIDALLRRLYQCHREEAFATTAIDGVQTLIGARQTTWNMIGPAGAVVMATPEEQQHELRQAALSELLAEHPLLCHRLETGDPSAHLLSDFVSRRAYHQSALYQRLYRNLEYEDLLVAFLPGVAGAGCETALAMGRDRPTFNERDRAMCELLRPHVAAAYRHAAALSRFYRRMEWRRLDTDEPMRAIIDLDDAGRIRSIQARAGRWIREHFGLARSAGRLPEELETWLRFRTGVPRPLERRKHRTRLTIHVDRAPAGNGTRLLLEKRRDAPGGSARLTRREREVLRHVEQGQRNQEIAAALGISVATVKKHLEHVFWKLGVTSRIAAVHRWRQNG